ncbi:hypothetical protein H5T52_04510 [Candidatus Bipolaricaulota bacterium]|nr:hypothetical protein [Candidatus Bipolaricaulota bacterium]
MALTADLKHRLGIPYRGVLVSDCFTAYDAEELEGWLRQKCFAHMLWEALRLKEEKPWLGEAEFRARLLVLEDKLDALIAEGRHFTDPETPAWPRD